MLSDSAGLLSSLQVAETVGFGLSGHLQRESNLRLPCQANVQHFRSSMKAAATFI